METWERWGSGRTEGEGLAWLHSSSFAGLVCCGLGGGSRLGAGEGLLVERDQGGPLSRG